MLRAPTSPGAGAVRQIRRSAVQDLDGRVMASKSIAHSSTGPRSTMEFPFAPSAHPRPTLILAHGRIALPVPRFLHLVRRVAAGAASTARLPAYLSSLTLRRGRRANHQMLAMVATTPSAAAGFAILRERSDMGLTIPASTEARDLSGPADWCRTVSDVLHSEVEGRSRIGLSYNNSGHPLPVASPTQAHRGCEEDVTTPSLRCSRLGRNPEAHGAGSLL
jgi:hypothetical protein